MGGVVEERRTSSLFLKPPRRLGLRFLVYAHLADSLARLASSPGGEVSDFPLGKMRAAPWKNLMTNAGEKVVVELTGGRN